MAYLTDHPPVRDQWYDKRNRPLTGCTVLHSTESIFDEMGVDTGAENVAEFIRRRTTPGSYHDIVDSDSDVPLVDYNHGAYHDGTGSNNWALSLAFACRTVDWNRMSPAKRAAMLRNGARAFVRQQAYRRSIGAPLTELRLISKAQSDAGMSGFTYHGLRDPGRRTDPGVAPPNLFPFEEFIAECRAVLSGVPEEDDEMPRFDLIRNKDTGAMVLAAPGLWYGIASLDYLKLYAGRGLVKSTAPDLDVPTNEFAHFRDIYLSAVIDTPIQRDKEAGGGVTSLRAQAHWEDHNLRTVVPEKVAELVAAPQVDVDSTAVGAALAADPEFMDALSDRIADKLAARLAS